MSVRIHQLSKKIGMENKELIALLTERGFNVKSPASTIDNISAESLIEEYSVTGQKETEEEEPAKPLPQAEQPSSTEQDGK